MSGIGAMILGAPKLSDEAYAYMAINESPYLQEIMKRKDQREYDHALAIERAKAIPSLPRLNGAINPETQNLLAMMNYASDFQRAGVPGLDTVGNELLSRFAGGVNENFKLTGEQKNAYGAAQENPNIYQNIMKMATDPAYAINAAHRNRMAEIANEYAQRRSLMGAELANKRALMGMDFANRQKLLAMNKPQGGKSPDKDFSSMTPAQQQKAMEKEAGKNSFDKTLKEMLQNIELLNADNAMPNVDKGVVDNVIASSVSNAPAQFVQQKIGGLGNQNLRDKIEGSKPLLQQFAAKALGMGVSQFNTGKESELFQRAMPDVAKAYQFNKDQIGLLSDLFGHGRDTLLSDNTGTAKPTMTVDEAYKAGLIKSPDDLKKFLEENPQ